MFRQVGDREIKWAKVPPGFNEGRPPTIIWYFSLKRPGKQTGGVFNFLSFFGAPKVVLGANDVTSKKL